MNVLRRATVVGNVGYGIEMQNVKVAIGVDMIMFASL